MRRSAVVCTAAIIVMLTGLSAAAANPTPTPVEVMPNVNHLDPSATTNYMAWAQNSKGAPHHYDVMYTPRSGGSIRRVNASGTEAYHPRPIEGTDSIVYQQYTKTSSDIYLFNMATHRRSKLGRKVNTSAWEYWPAASTKYVLFVRATRKARLLLLYNRKSGEVLKLASVGPKCSCLLPDWVGQHHVVYSICSSKTSACQVKLVTLGVGTTTVPGKGAPYSQYGAVMDEATGNVYYISSTTRCGLFVEIDRWNTFGGPPTTIYDMDEGIDANSVSLAPSVTTPGDIDLYFSDWDCLKDDADLYTIPSVNTL